jgi:hypothetical protein
LLRAQIRTYWVLGKGFMKIYVIIGIMAALMLTMTASSTVDRFGYVHNVVLGFSTLEDLDHYYKDEESRMRV